MLGEVENKLLEKMNELFQALIGKFADKSEMRKALKQLEA
jgi:hypothetical protein